MINLKQPSSSPITHSFDLTDRGLLLADGVFDTSLVVEGSVFCREMHLKRLLRDTAALGIAISKSEVDGFIDDSVPDNFSGALRVTISRGTGSRGLLANDDPLPTLIAHISKIDRERQFRPVALHKSEICRNPNSVTAHHKTLSYTDNIMAARGAQRLGCDDALMPGVDSKLVCASSGNLFFRADSTLVTPPLDDGALGGVMREWVMEMATTCGMQVDVRSVFLNDLPSFDQVFMTNSLRLIAPVARVDQYEFDTSELTGLTDLLRDQLKALAA